MIFSKIDIDKAKDFYHKAKPFPFVVIDDFLDENIAELIWKDLAYLMPNKGWNFYDSPLEKKFTNDKWELIPDVTRCVLAFLNTSMTTSLLEEITNISGLLPDPSIRGAGISYVLPGGKLDLHSDRQIHPKLNVYRRLNLLIYFNKNWSDNYGGSLELWNSDVTKCEHKISPIFNRMVLFETNDHSYHGHPDPLTCPIGMARKALSLYYWTSTIPEDFKINEMSTDFRGRPGENNPELEALREQRRKAIPKK